MTFLPLALAALSLCLLTGEPMSTQQDPPALGADQVRAIATARAELYARCDQLRPALYRHCHGLCGNALDAEDLVQESFAKAFARLGERHSGIENLRSYLFRIATNTWLDELRRQRPELLASVPEPVDETDVSEALDLGEAYAHLLQRVDARGRAAILLCDAFGFGGEEAAAMLGIGHGHLRVLLHRARKELRAGDATEPERAAPPPVRTTPLLTAFAAAFRARDVPRLLELNASVTEHDIVGIYGGLGDDVAKNIFEHTFADPQLVDAQLLAYRGETLLVLWYEHEGQRVLRDVLRVEGHGEQIARVRYYYFCPEALTAVARELGLPVRTQGYRYPKQDDR